MKCAYKDCKNKATGKCEGHQKCNYSIFKCYTQQESFLNDCGKYFCQEHLDWGWGCIFVNGCSASPQCPYHHTGIKCIIS